VNGALYGTTSNGGAHGNGTVFKIARSGRETVLYNFTGGADGGGPRLGSLIEVRGTLFGSTEFGGINGNGTVFGVAP
jgi:uncharacterized repeat protein (TIGR03803 family)